MTDKAIAFSDPKVLAVAAKPLDANGQLIPQVAKLVDSITLGENDTAILVGTTSATTMIKTRMLKNGAQANQIKVLTTSFKLSALDLQLSGITDQDQNGTVDSMENENVAAIQVMHRPTLADLSPATDAPNQNTLPVPTP